MSMVGQPHFCPSEKYLEKKFRNIWKLLEEWFIFNLSNNHKNTHTMHRVIARTRSVDVAEESARSFVPDGKRQILGIYKCFWQEFDTEAEARALIMRSIMNYERGDPDTMRIKLINFLYQDYYCTPYVFVTYDNTEIITKQHISYAAEEGNN